MNETAVAVTVTPEAAARVAELGMHAQFEAMLDYARQSVPGLRRIEVRLNERYDTGDEPGVFIEVFAATDADACYQAERRCDRWFIDTFPSGVLEHFLLRISPEAGHAG
jgi:hypothetical protein